MELLKNFQIWLTIGSGLAFAVGVLYGAKYKNLHEFDKETIQSLEKSNQVKDAQLTEKDEILKAKDEHIKQLSKAVQTPQVVALTKSVTRLTSLLAKRYKINNGDY